MDTERKVYVGASCVGEIEQLFDRRWLAVSYTSKRRATFPSDVRAECWVREELYCQGNDRTNPYEPEAS